MKRANYLPAPAAFQLNHACAMLDKAFGACPYLVGSALERRDYRDVDVRLILGDEAFDQLFPGAVGHTQQHALWSLLCASISLWLQQATGLPVDFQIQRQTQANAEYHGPRHALGIFLGYARGAP